MSVCGERLAFGEKLAGKKHGIDSVPLAEGAPREHAFTQSQRHKTRGRANVPAAAPNPPKPVAPRVDVAGAAVPKPRGFAAAGLLAPNRPPPAGAACVAPPNRPPPAAGWAAWVPNRLVGWPAAGVAVAPGDKHRGGGRVFNDDTFNYRSYSSISIENAAHDQ